MNTTKKLVIAVVALALALISFASVSLAWLVSKPAPVVNTFTVGDITITLDELDVDNDTTTSDNVEYTADGTTTIRDKANSYKLVPGQTYTKDPTVHVEAGNEKCYVFVTVDNAIADYEASGDTTIAAQINANGWTNLQGTVYYKVVEATKNTDKDTDLIVFSNFTIDGAETKTTLANVTDATLVKITAYAIQYASFEDKPADAWAAVYAAANE